MPVYNLLDDDNNIVSTFSRIEDAVAFTKYNIDAEGFRLSDFTFKAPYPDMKACQIALQFGDVYCLSIINDGLGSKQGLFEIAILNNEHEFIRLPGISHEDDDVLGHQTAQDVSSIIAKLSYMTGFTPTQKQTV